MLAAIERLKPERIGHGVAAAESEEAMAKLVERGIVLEICPTSNLRTQAVRDLTATFVYNDLASLERIFEAHPGEVAAVILEPYVSTLPEPGFLEGIRELTHREGAVLVFDEVITGFRLANGGAQEYFGVTPDLTCLGKAIANGFPLSAIVGKADLMRALDEVFFSLTFGGEAVSLAAAKATIATGGVIMDIKPK